MGGHSLLATQVIARIQATFQVEVPLLRLFEAPTIARLATEMTQNLERKSERQTIHLLALLEQFPKEE